MAKWQSPACLNGRSRNFPWNQTFNPPPLRAAPLIDDDCAQMLAVFLAAPTAFVASSRRSSVVTRAVVRLESERPETEMEYLKRRADEKGENGGGWSIFKAKDEDAKPDPPWLVASKQRAAQRAERTERTEDAKRPWWKGADYSDEDSAGLPTAPSVPWFKRMDDSPAEESPAEESSKPAEDADAEK